MKIQVLSDLHLEKGNNLESNVASDILIVAGDICRADNVVEKLLEHFSSTAYIVFVTGNHEYYKMDKTIPECNQIIRNDVNKWNGSSLSYPKLVFLDDSVEVIYVNDKPVRLVGGTLWTDFDLYHNSSHDKKYVEKTLNDYYYIKGAQSSPFNTQILRPDETLGYHKETISIIEKTITEPFDGPTIVVTHHLPSLRCIAPQYKSDRMTAGFASNLDHLVNDYATLWVCGHTHTTKITRFGDTLLACNPMGYKRGLGYENKRFKNDLLIDIRKGGPDKKWIAGV